MKPTKQTVYIPVSEFNSSERAVCTIGIPDLYGDKVVEQEGYFFTPEQLNDYTSNVIKQALETAAENVNMIGKTQHDNGAPDVTLDFVYVIDSNGPDYGYVVNKQSITNTFNETFKKFEV